MRPTIPNPILEWIRNSVHRITGDDPATPTLEGTLNLLAEKLLQNDRALLDYLDMLASSVISVQQVLNTLTPGKSRVHIDNTFTNYHQDAEFDIDLRHTDSLIYSDTWIVGGHQDEGYFGTHSDSGYHQDQTVEHSDYHGDHSDHYDQAHGDIAHANYSDTTHNDINHANVAHQDSSYHSDYYDHDDLTDFFDHGDHEDDYWWYSDAPGYIDHGDYGDHEDGWY